MVSGLNLRICGWKYRVLKTSICANKFDNGRRVWQLVAGRVLWSVLEYWTTGRANITSSRLCHMSRWILMKGLFRMHRSDTLNIFFFWSFTSSFFQRSLLTKYQDWFGIVFQCGNVLDDDFETKSIGQVIRDENATKSISF